MSDIFTQLANIGIVPVVEIVDAEHAVPLAHALQAGGINTMEVTFRTNAAAEAIRRVATEVADFVVGAGTLLTPDDIDQAVAAGASYGVSPAFTPNILAAIAHNNFPFIPGVITPSEILVAATAGHRYLKFFPAAQYGGLATLKSLTAPFAKLNLAFMPTGGVREADFADYLALPQVFAVGGTWIAPKREIIEGRFTDIEARARRTHALIPAP